MKFNERLKYLRMQKHLTQKELSVLLKTSVVTVQCWENGSKKPSMDAIISLADVFDVSIDYLLGHYFRAITDYEMQLIKSYRLLNDREKSIVDYICSLAKDNYVNDRAQSIDDFRYIPLYETPAAAGISDPIENDHYSLIRVSNTISSRADYAVKIQGNSMLPYITDGETVYVERNAEINNGDIGIFCVDGSMFCKQYYLDKFHNITLVSANPEYQQTNIAIGADSGRSLKYYGKVIINSKTTLPAYLK